MVFTRKHGDFHGQFVSLPEGTLPKTNTFAPENRPKLTPQKETSLVFQPSIFGCELFVSGRVLYQRHQAAERFVFPRFFSWPVNNTQNTEEVEGFG